MSPTNPVEAQAQPLIDKAKEHLAKRKGVSPDQIDVLKVEAVQWRDSSLGNPQPGQMYAQVITPGYRIVLSGQGKEFVYHTDMRHVVPIEPDHR